MAKRPQNKKAEWDDHWYVKAYECARSGLSDTNIAEALGINWPRFKFFLEIRAPLKDAIERGRQAGHQGKEERETYLDYVYGRLPRRLRDYWSSLREAEDDPDGRPPDERIRHLLEEVDEKAIKHLFLHALVQFNFNPSRACESLEVKYSTFMKWKDKDKDFEAIYKEVQWHRGNLYEDALVERIKQGDTAAIIFANKTYNRDRGYAEKSTVEVQGEVKHDHRFSVDALDLPLEVRRQILEAIRKKEEHDALLAKEQVLIPTRAYPPAPEQPLED